MTSHVKLKMGFGLTLDGKLIKIQDAANGLKCGLVCPGCKTEVLARQGAINSWHFAHHGIDCSKYADEVLKMIVKESLMENLKITLPTSLMIKHDSRKSFLNQVFKGHYNAFTMYDEHNPEFYLNDDFTYMFNKIDFNVELSFDFTADILIYSKDEKRKFIIEISTNPTINPTRLEKIKNLNIACLQIDVSSYKKELQTSETFSFDGLKMMLKDDTYIFKWIVNEKLFNSFKILEKQFYSQMNERKIYGVSKSKFLFAKIYNCPLKCAKDEAVKLFHCVGSCDKFFAIEQTNEQNGWKLKCLGCSSFERV